MIGLSFVDLFNTLKDKEFLRDAWSQGVAGSGEAKLPHGVKAFGITILPSLQSTLVFSTSWVE